MANKVINIETVVDGFKQPVTSGNFSIRIAPFTSDTIVGSHLGDGAWEFQNAPYEDYELWNVTTNTKVSKFSRQTIASKGASLTSLYVSGNTTLTGGLVYIAGQPINLGPYRITADSTATINSTNALAFQTKQEIQNAINASTSSITASLNGYATLAGNNSFSGTNHFDNIVTIDAGFEVQGFSVVGFENTNRMYFGVSNSNFVNFNRSPLCVEEMDVRYASLTGVNIFTGVNAFTDLPTANSHATLSANNQLIRYSDLTNAISKSAATVAPQVVRLIPGGVISNEFNSFVSWTGAVNSITTKQSANPSIRCTLLVEGASGTNIIDITTVPYGTTVFSRDKNIQFALPNSTLYPTTAPFGLSNMEFTTKSSSGSPTLRNAKIDNCYFDFQGSGQTGNTLTFRDVEFGSGVRFRMGSNSLEFVSCTGQEIFSDVTPSIDSGSYFNTIFNTTSSKFGTLSSHKIGFYGSTPVVKPSLSGLLGGSVSANFLGTPNTLEEWSPAGEPDWNADSQTVYNSMCVLSEKVKVMERIMQRLGLWQS